MPDTPSVRIAAAMALAGALAALAPPAQAQVYKCPQAGGSVSYQSTPCATGTPQGAHPTAAELNAAQHAQATAAARPTADPYATRVDARPRAAGPLKPSVASPLPEDAHVVTAEDRQRACTIALNNEAVLGRTGNKACSFDRTGNRNDVMDADRANLLAAARRNEARYCK